MPQIVVIGAGVSGLTSALLLSKNPAYKITIIAKHMPGDYDIEYASPWAGADYVPDANEQDSNRRGYEKATWPELAHLAQDVPAAGISFRDVISYKLNAGLPWYSTIVPCFRTLEPAELPPGISSGTTFRSVCINTPIYLSWLVSQCLTAGVTFKRGVLRHILDAKAKDTDLIVNCTGLSALKLAGVTESPTNLLPVRGQIVVVRNSTHGKGYTASNWSPKDAALYPDDTSYIMERAAGGGTVLGGTYMKGSWESQPDPNAAIRIMKRAIEICPELVKPGEGIEGLSVVRHAVGLRPLRVSGVRVEREKISGDGENGKTVEVEVVHNYGHGGWGYQSSYGCAEHVVKLVEEALGMKAKMCCRFMGAAIHSPGVEKVCSDDFLVI